MMMAWTLFLSYARTCWVKLPVGQENIMLVPGESFPVMLSRVLSWIPPGCCNLVATWVFFKTLCASIFICYNFMAVVFCFLDHLGRCVCALYLTGEQFTLYKVKYVLLSRIQCLCCAGFMIHLGSKRTIYLYVFGCKES